MTGEILIILAGNTHPKVARKEGNYDSWFARALSGKHDVRVVAPFLGETLPNEAFAGIIVTGSAASVRDEARWMGEVASYCLEAERKDTPILGVCFGSQLLGEALGGRIEASEKGRECGTVSVRLTEEGRKDPLFDGVPDEFRVHTIHGDELVRPPAREGVVRLAGNDHSSWQSFAWGPRVRGVQFHPEFTSSVMERILDALGLDAEVEETDHGKRILRNWEQSLG